MIQKTLVKANACVVEIQEDLISGIVTIMTHVRLAPGSDCYDYVISKEKQPVLIYKPEKTNKALDGMIFKD